jgi:chemotaxis signal transduction protein
MRVLVLAVNAAYFAVPMATVLQVLRHPVVTRVPLSPSGLLGVVNVRGEIVPLLDTGVMTATGALSDPPFAVLVNGEKDVVALAAEELPTATDFEEPVGSGTTVMSPIRTSALLSVVRWETKRQQTIS